MRPPKTPQHSVYRLMKRFALLLLLALAAAGAMNAKDRRIQRFYSEIVVMSNGDVDVTENITMQFIGGPWQGVYRDIPVEYAGPHGMNYSLFVDVKSVRDANGHKLRFESSRESFYRRLKIFVPNADDSTQTIVINYVVSDALRFFEDHDELYWNVTGDEWKIPIETSGAHIVLPENASNIRANAFTGAYRSTGRNAEVSIVGNGVDVTATIPLQIHEGLTVAVAFDKGAVKEPTALDRLVRTLRSNWPLFIPIFAFFGMFWLWWTRGRDPRLRPIAAQYEPPDKLTPGEVGTLVDNSVDMRDVTATIVDLAVRGYIKIEQVEKDHLLGLTHSKDYVFHLRKPREQWGTLTAHEQDLLGGMFAAGTEGETVAVGDLQNRFYKTIPSIKNSIFGSLIQRGYYAKRPDSVRSSYIGMAFVCGFILIWGGLWISKRSGMQPLAFVIAGLLTGLIVAAFGWFMPARTQTGARALEGVLGFEDFLAHVESDRFNRMIKTPEMFEKFLPFAMALGVEKNWSKAFQGIYTQPPDWYSGAYGPNFYPYMFVNDLNSMSTLTSSAMTSAPRSAEGSGFGGGDGGGGFSGGGFGGGGGDAF